MLLCATLTTAAAALLPLPVTAMLIAGGNAYADPRDNQYGVALSARVILAAPEQTVAAGHACTTYGSPDLVAQMTGPTARGLSNGQAQEVIPDELKAYRPEDTGGVPLP